MIKISWNKMMNFTTYVWNNYPSCSFNDLIKNEGATFVKNNESDDFLLKFENPLDETFFLLKYGHLL